MPHTPETNEPSERRREYSWSDPRELAALAPRTAGIDFLKRIVSGELPHPPTASTLGFAFTAVEPGVATVEADPHEFAYNGIATVHGGVIATWADTAIGYAIQSLLPEGVSVTTLDLQVRYLKAIRVETGSVTIVATADHVGRSTGTAHAVISDREGRLLATATSTCLVLQPRTSPPIS